MTLYLIRAGETGPVRMGWSVAPEVQCHQMQSYHWEKLEIIRQFDCARDGLKWFQDEFQLQWIRGNWFEFTPTMLTIEPPAMRAKTISRAFGIPLHEIRPDLWARANNQQERSWDDPPEAKTANQKQGRKAPPLQPR